MKAFWQAQARRIDARTLRERVVMFVSLALALGALADALVLSPAMAERRRLAAQMRQRTVELETLRVQVGAGAAAADTPLARQRAGVERSRAELQALDGELQQRLARRDELTRLPELLERVLRRHPRLTLTRLETLPDTGAPAEPGALRWQGVELSVAGSYLDLMPYLAELERELPGLRWGALQIGTQAQPPVMTVRLLLAGEAS